MAHAAAPAAASASLRQHQHLTFEICAQLSAQSKTPVTPGESDGNRHQVAATVLIAGDAVPARDLLSRALDAMGGHLGWRLLYDAGNKTYTLSLGGPPQ